MTLRRPAILYAEVPSFYAAVECASDPTLRSRAVIVGGDPRKRGQVQSASPSALGAGVTVGMSMLQALERCPHAKAVRTDMKRYRQVSSLFNACLRGVVEAVEPSGLGAAFLDAVGVAESPEQTASLLAGRVREQLNLPLRVGIAPVKFLAKLAADRAGGAGNAGQEGVLRISAGSEPAFLRPLALGCLPGVGPKTVARLAEMGAHRVGDLLEIDPSELEKELGNHGLRILEFARGQDDSRVRAARHPQSLGQEFTFDEEQLDMDMLWDGLQRLAQGLEAALRREGLCARGVAVKVRYADQETTTRRRTHTRPVTRSADIQASATSLLDRTHAGTRPIRLLGISLTRLAKAKEHDQQLGLFEPGD